MISKGGEGERIKSKLEHWLHPCLAFEQVILGVKLDESDLKCVADLWEDVINPACIKFAEDTRKPAEAFREAIVMGFERHVKKFHWWNTWERIWWSTVPEIQSKDLLGKLYPCHNCPLLTRCINHTAELQKSCCRGYEEEVAKQQTKAELDEWIRKLEFDLTKLSDIEAQEDST